MEVLKSDGSSWCSLADMPEDRSEHTQSGLFACGGFAYPIINTCIRFSNGTWTKSHDNLDDRMHHTAWSSTEHGIRLMGNQNTELLADDGKTPSSFPLKDYTS